jgi:hypothetical protein
MPGFTGEVPESKRVSNHSFWRRSEFLVNHNTKTRLKFEGCTTPFCVGHFI